MAKIPTRSTTRELPAAPNQLPSVRMTAAPTARDLGADARPRNEGALRDLRSANEHFAEATAIIEKRQDHTAVMTTLAEAQKAVARQQAEMASQQGAFAKGSTERTSTWFDDQHEEFAGRLQNDRQRRAFEEQWSQLRTNATTAASKHEVVEGRRADVEASKAAITGAAELAAASYDDPQALATYRAQILAASQAVAAFAGHKADSQVTALEKLNNLSMMHERVITAMAKNDPTAAEQYLKDNAGDLNATTRERATKLVETSSRLRKVQAFADEATLAMPEADAIAAARKKFEGEDEEKAVAEVKARYAEQTAARERLQKDAADEAWRQALDRGSYARIDPTVIARMDGRDQAAIQRHFTQQQESRARTAAAVESRAFAAESRDYTRRQRERTERGQKAADRYNEIRALATTDRAAFEKVDPRRENDVLLPDQIASLMSLKAKPPVEDFITYAQQLSRATAMMDKEDKAAFTIAVDRMMEDETRAAGKKLTQEQRQKIIDRAQLDVKVGRDWWFDSSKKAYELDQQTVQRAYVPGMPDLPRPAVDAYLQGVPKEALPALLDDAKKRGITPTSGMLIQQYQFQQRTKK